MMPFNYITNNPSADNDNDNDNNMMKIMENVAVVTPDSSYREDYNYHHYHHHHQQQQQQQQVDATTDDLNALLRMPLPEPFFYEQYITDGSQDNCNDVWSGPFHQHDNGQVQTTPSLSPPPTPVTSSSSSFSQKNNNTNNNKDSLEQQPTTTSSSSFLPTLGPLQQPNPLVKPPPVSITPLPPNKRASISSCGYKLQDLVVWLLDEQDDVDVTTTDKTVKMVEEERCCVTSLSPIEKECITLGLPRAPTYCGRTTATTTTTTSPDGPQTNSSSTPFQEYSNQNVMNPLIQLFCNNETTTTSATKKKTKKQPKKKKSLAHKKEKSLLKKKKLPAKNQQQQPKLRVYQKENWWKRYGELEQFYNQNGHSQVSSNNNNNNVHKKELARWVKRQRYQYRHLKEGLPSSMTQERIVALEKLDFVWDSHEAAWDIHMNELKAYKVKYGHCNVPSTCPNYKGLASWVKYQRRQYRLFQAGSEEETYINIDRINQLEEMGFQWNRRKSL